MHASCDQFRQLPHRFVTPRPSLTLHEASDQSRLGHCRRGAGRAHPLDQIPERATSLSSWCDIQLALPFAKSNLNQPEEIPTKYTAPDRLGTKSNDQVKWTQF